jgi:tetratricopeptide (TPR) repeat protein
MAFGFGFNKQKALSSAEKFVQQGKLQNAIAEYQKVLKADSRDLTVSNTIGDLYARLGQNDKAVESFKSVGDAYATQGFTVKAIAMYKKLTKIKSTLESVLRLAELYTQQGLFNDARAQYLQVAEEFLRAGELEQAVRIFQKTLEMDPENVAMRVRLAEVYIRLGKKTEAWQLFAAAADSLRGKGQLAQAEEILQRMLTLDPGNSYALLLQGRTAADTGDFQGAIAHLEKVADLDTHPEGLRALMQAYLQAGRIAEAGALAAKLYSVHNDAVAITGYADALLAAGHFEQVLQVYQEYSERLLASDSAKVLETLHVLIGPLRESPSALETLLEISVKAGDSTHVTELYELLGHACVQSRDLEKARDCYLKLTQLEPQNQVHAQNYQQVLTRLAGGVAPPAKLITAEEGAVMVDELEATAPFIDQRYADDVALAVRAALTDAELFVSYNMPAKALGPLSSALPKAPRDLRVNQRLVSLHTRAGRFAEAAVCCRTLEQLYHDAGHPDEATRYAELGTKYEERASRKPVEAKPVEVKPVKAKPAEEKPVSSASAEVKASASPVTPAPAASGLFWQKPGAPAPMEPGEFEVPAAPADGEIDISEEWEGELAGADAAPEPEETETAAEPARVSAAEIEEVVEEIRFYLSQSMVEQARMVFAKLENICPGEARLAALRHEIDRASVQSPAPESETIEEISVEEIPHASVDETPEPKSRPGKLKELVSDLETSIGEGFLPKTARKVAAEPEPALKEVAQANTSPAHAGVLGEFVSDLEASLGHNFVPQAALPVEARPQPVAAKSARASSSLATASAAAATAPAVESAAPAPAFSYKPSKPRPLAPEAPTPGSGAGVDLADLFGELKQELEDGAGTVEEDPETHYNLGVAFREMGLLDEAIAELQKVCQAVDRGHPFPQLMQTYTWLAQCFLDKNVPEAAIRWYERALKLKGIGEETKVALNYELASAYESAGNKPAALNHFMEVYGSNIDYRDVAERIKTLKS